MVSSKNFVLPLTFRSDLLIHVELIFLMLSYIVYSISSKFNSFVYGCPFVLAPFIEDSPVPH